MNHPIVADESHVFAIERPAPALLNYYIISSLALGPFFFLALIPLYFRYHTLRYRFDAEGIHMRWGILFRREVNLTYARVQDIHLRSNLVERWLGLARIEVQTASGSSGAEMTLEGLLEFEAIRNYLYTRMRGAHVPQTSTALNAGIPAGDAHELVQILREISNEVRAIRSSLESSRGASSHE